MHAAQPHSFQAIVQTMLHGIVEAICDRRDDTAARRDIRSRDVVHSVLGFQPRDPVEVMLAGMAVTHVHLIQDSAHDLWSGQDDALKATTKSTIVALDRGMLGFLRELRTAQTRAPEANETAAPDTQPVAAGSVLAPPDVPAVPVATVTEPELPPARGSVPAAFATARPPVTHLPPLRTAETSIAAMMAVVSPPVAISRAPVRPRGQNAAAPR